MKVLLLLLALVFLTACTSSPAIYDGLFDTLESSFWDDSVVFSVTHTERGAVLLVRLQSEEVRSLRGELIYDRGLFDVRYEKLSDWVCDYNQETRRVACASASPAEPGNVFRFSLVAKEGVEPGRHPLEFNVFDINGVETSVGLDTTISVR